MRDWTCGLLFCAKFQHDRYIETCGVKSRRKVVNLTKSEFCDSCTNSLYYTPPDRSGTNLARECRPVVYAVSWQISLWSVHRVAVDERKTRNLTIFSNSTFCVGAIWWQRDKVERGCTPTNLPVSNDIKVLTEFRRLDGDNACNSTV